MCCNFPIQTGVRKAEDCVCYKAVMRTFKSMMSDEPFNVALEAAIRVYRYHHPEDKKHDAHLTVERWVNAQHVH
ncbi:MAG: hypothetical protein ACK4VI_06840 [Alphaproteobacteria bacterium]